MSDKAAPLRPPRTRRTAADRLRAALADLHQHRGQVLTHTEKAWASITFAGTRHSLAILFAGDEAVEAGVPAIPIPVLFSCPRHFPLEKVRFQENTNMRQL